MKNLTIVVLLALIVGGCSAQGSVRVAEPHSSSSSTY